MIVLLMLWNIVFMHSVRQKYWQYTSANAKKQKKCKNGFVKCHKLFINLKILNVNIARIANIIQSTITVIASRAGVVVKIVFQMKPVNVANTALNTVKSNFKKPISSLILSLFTKLQYFIYCIMVYFAFVKHCIAGEITHQTHCDLDFGYYFYCEESTQEPKQNNNYEEKLQTMKQELELKKAKAVMEPNETNVQDYMEYQKRVLDNSSKFADTWRKVLWKNPDLDYTLKHPTNTTAKHKEIDLQRDKIKQTLAKLSERYGIFFVYKSTCPYCHKYAENLQEFKAIYGVDIIGITLDGVKIQGWEDSTITDLRSLTKIGMQEIKQVPATVLFDNKTKSVLPVGYGLLSITELEERIYVLINQNTDENGF